MKKKITNILFVAISLSGMFGCGQSLTGSLQIAANETLQVRDSDRNEEALHSGRSSVNLEKNILFGSTRTLTVKNLGKKLQIGIPDSAFLSASDFAVSSKEIGQDFDLKATQKRQWIGTPSQENGAANCTHGGYCIDCSPTIDGTMNCGEFKYKFNCPGKQSAVFSKQKYRDITSIVFSRQNKPVATFTSDAPTQIASKVIKKIGSCN